MTDVERIQAAEDKIAVVQDALAMAQTGLRKAEEIATAEEQTKGGPISCSRWRSA